MEEYTYTTIGQKSLRCSGRTTERKRCKRTISLPKTDVKELWHCTAHEVKNNVPMRESNGQLFYIMQNGCPVVEQIRKKIYISGKPKYLIEGMKKNFLPKWVDADEFYTLAENYTFFALE